MAKKMLVKLLLLLMVFEALLVSVSEGWRRRRRRRCSWASPAGVAWANSWHGQVNFVCSYSNSIRYWRSIHRNCHEDRIHYFQCGYGPVSYGYGNCHWSGYYVHDFDQLVSYKCPHNGFIVGIRSEYSGHHRDRRFNFRCCHKSGYITHTCQTTPYRNWWDHEISYHVPGGYYLVGVISVHDNHYEDRRYRFEVCKFTWAG